MVDGLTPIPAFVNPGGGSAAEAERALAEAGTGFDVRRVAPVGLAAAIRAAIADGATRVVVVGGDGTIQIAASVLAGSPVELAVVPGGTLNHFARDYGVPLDRKEAVDVAKSGAIRAVDVGVVNDRIFINTSSVGAYVSFVATREWFERYVGYGFASLFAGLRMLPRLRRFRATLERPDAQVVSDTPLLFVGVGERTLTPPEVGARIPGGARALHVIVVPRPGHARRWSRSFDRFASGRASQWRGWSPSFVDAYLVDGGRVELSPKPVGIAFDGQITSMQPPLEYRLWRDALHLLVRK
jgi:diacylglycerol kinase family enzyme